MSPTLSEPVIALVKATVPALEANGLEIVRTMYDYLFRTPAIRDLFDQSHHGESSSQPKALATAILAYARNIDNLAVLAPAVERIAQKHVGLQIEPDHYSYVADALIAAIRDVLGEAATPDILNAWGEAYWFLADVLIGRERQLYEALAGQPGGWRGWRDFVIAAKVVESEVITSFVLDPVDGGAVVAHKPGQYLTFWFDLPGQRPLKRNYSISSAPDDRRYRITVKRDGVASTWLHEEADVGTVLKVAPPAGEFFLRDSGQRPVVLLSGGVGLTPMISMLEAAANENLPMPIHYVHGTHSGATHAMAARIRELADRHANVRATTFYLDPRADDVRGRDYDEAGLIDGDWLRAHTPVTGADFYLCGPKPFLRAFVGELTLAGVPAERIHFEFFGPADELIAA